VVVTRFLLLHGGNPFDELLVAAAGAAFLIAGWIVIRMAPSPEAPEASSEATPEPSPSDTETEETPIRLA
jgi:hypothetical protein